MRSFGEHSSIFIGNESPNVSEPPLHTLGIKFSPSFKIIQTKSQANLERNDSIKYCNVSSSVSNFTS